MGKLKKSDFMKNTSADHREFAEWMWAIIKDAKPLTKNDLPYVWYCEDGDILHIIVSLTEDGYYGEWINHDLTTLKEFKTDKFLGFELWGFSEMTDTKINKILSIMLSMGIDVSGAVRRKIRKYALEVKK